jgi:single-strand DNA-binding protein
MDTLVVMNGYVGSKVEYRQGEGFTYAWFSLGCTPRFRTGTGEWRDGETTWITVHCSRALADNVNFSLHKGEPVVVIGRLTTRSFERPDGSGKGSALQVEATAVGHDLNTGCSLYHKTLRPAAKGATPSDTESEPAEDVTTFDSTESESPLSADIDAPRYDDKEEEKELARRKSRLAEPASKPDLVDV